MSCMYWRYAHMMRDSVLHFEIITATFTVYDYVNVTINFTTITLPSKKDGKIQFINFGAL